MEVSERTEAISLARRCAWAKNDVAIRYHDEEWGVPVHDDRLLFEFLISEVPLAVEGSSIL